MSVFGVVIIIHSFQHLSGSTFDPSQLCSWPLLAVRSWECQNRNSDLPTTDLGAQRIWGCAIFFVSWNVQTKIKHRPDGNHSSYMYAYILNGCMIWFAWYMHSIIYIQIYMYVSKWWNIPVTGEKQHLVVISENGTPMKSRLIQPIGFHPLKEQRPFFSRLGVVI